MTKTGRVKNMTYEDDSSFIVYFDF